jgi:hypothetical protein
VSNPRMDKPSKFSRAARRRDSPLSRICDTHEAASGGLPQEQVQQLLKGVTQPVRGYRSQLKIFPDF